MRKQEQFVRESGKMVKTENNKLKNNKKQVFPNAVVKVYKKLLK